jgi:hypothetical protein
LADKVAAEESQTDDAVAAPNSSGSGAKNTWSTNKAERQALLQKRKEEMILAARRKLEAKILQKPWAGLPSTMDLEAQEVNSEAQEVNSEAQEVNSEAQEVNSEAQTGEFRSAGRRDELDSMKSCQ